MRLDPIGGRQTQDPDDAVLAEPPPPPGHRLLREAEDRAQPAEGGAAVDLQRVDDPVVRGVEHDTIVRPPRAGGGFRRHGGRASRNVGPGGTLGDMRKWLPLVAICLGTFMLLIDVTIVNVALPDIARDLGTSFAQLQWVVDVYALALAALVLGAGSLADLYGRRRLYLAGLVAVRGRPRWPAGWLPMPSWLIAARAVQGVGGAACSPPPSR